MKQRYAGERQRANVNTQMAKQSGYVLQLLEAQATLFAEKPKALALRELPFRAEEDERVRINVWRNHAFETVAASAQVYSDYFDLGFEFEISDYDDSLQFTSHTPAQCELIWLDRTRYAFGDNASELVEWLASRLKALRTMSSAPIVVVGWELSDADGPTLLDIADPKSAIYFANCAELVSADGPNLLDPRTAKLAGTPLNGRLLPLFARKLACHWIAAAVLPPIKAIALDLDNTMYAGILGEDGAKGISVSEGHTNLHRFVLDCQRKGIFLAVVSKNEEADVKDLFDSRDDIELRLSDFSCAEISWDRKCEALKRIAENLRIGPSAILFVDDNIGELMSAANEIPRMKIVGALADANITLRSIEYYPGLWRWTTSDEDMLRLDDAAANAERENLASASVDSGEYFRSLAATVGYRYDCPGQIQRLSDLCLKTNQFNLALRRLSKADIVNRINDEAASVVGVSLCDRLADSGIIAVVVGRREGKVLIIEELCVSCRALGRFLEDTIISGAIRGMPIFIGCEQIQFVYSEGPRNKPARRWLAVAADLDEEQINDGVYSLPSTGVADFRPPAGVTIVQDQFDER